MSESQGSAQESKLDLVLVFKNFWHLFRRTFWLVILAAVLFGAKSGIQSYRSYSPYYEAQAVLSVSSGYSSTVDILNNSSYYNTSATRQVISTFSDIINTDAMREMILQDLGTTYINGSITPAIIANSNLFTLTVTSSNPEDAYNILLAVIDNYPKLASLVIGSTQISMLEAPVVPTEPVNAPSWRGAAKRGAEKGALLMLVIIALLSQLRRTIHSAEEMKRYSSLTCLSQVPTVPQYRRSSGQSHPSMLRSDLPSGYAEAIRTLRTRLLHELDSNPCKTIMITSTAPSEGKSTISANLALSLAKAGSRVILVDADLRVQSLQRFFGIKGKVKGLPELLSGSVDNIEDCLQTIPGTTMQLLASSTSVQSPAKLLRSTRIQKVLATLQDQADFVIVDTPPIGLLADAASFSRLVDGVVYVVREDFASRSEVLRCLQALSDSRASLLGYVLNGTSRSSNRYGYGYSYGKYGYGKSGYDAYGK